MTKKTEKKKIFLDSLKWTIKKYKRYSGSPLRYWWWKSLAVWDIIEYLPKNLEKVVSPFFGWGSEEIAIAKELWIQVIWYDIFDLLINYWDYQIKEPQKLYDGLMKLKPTKEEYERIKDELKKTWNKNTGSNNYLDNQTKAIYYYFNHNLSYWPWFLGWMSSIYLNEKKYLSMLEKVKKFLVWNLRVFCESFEKVLPKHKNDFLYLDPPYFLEWDSKMFRWIYPMRNFPIHHNSFNHQLLADLLKQHKWWFILSYNDCSWIRETYKDYKIIEIAWQYTMWQWETRIWKNRLERDFDNWNIKNSHELLIIW